MTRSQKILTVSVVAAMELTLVSACGKHDDGGSSGGSNNTVPNVGLVAGSDFKNTAKNSQEVSDKLRAGCTAISESKMNTRSSSTSCAQSTKVSNNLTSLHKDLMSSFLAGQDFKVSSLGIGSTNSGPSAVDMNPNSLNLADGQSCQKTIESINSAYRKTAESLRDAADLLTSMADPNQKLPDGLTVSGPTEQYAVIYTADIGKMQRQAESNSQHAANGKSSVDANGTMSIGAGANDSMAVVGLSADVVSTEDGAAMNVKGSFVTAVDSAAKLLKVNFDASATGQTFIKTKSTTTTHNDGSSEESSSDDSSDDATVNSIVKADGNVSSRKLDVNLSANSLFILKAGDAPEMTLGMLLNSNLTFDEAGRVISSDKVKTVTIKYALNAADKNNILVSYEVAAEGRQEGGKFQLQTDKYGHCTAKKN